jgi:hypothetical protein
MDLSSQGPGFLHMHEATKNPGFSLVNTYLEYIQGTVLETRASPIRSHGSGEGISHEKKMMRGKITMRYSIVFKLLIWDF